MATDDLNIHITGESHDIPLDLFTRDGAIAMLSQMRDGLHSLAMTIITFTDGHLTPTQVTDALEELLAQAYAMSCILGGILGDPTVREQVERHKRESGSA